MIFPIHLWLSLQTLNTGWETRLKSGTGWDKKFISNVEDIQDSLLTKASYTLIYWKIQHINNFNSIHSSTHMDFPKHFSFRGIRHVSEFFSSLSTRLRCNYSIKSDHKCDPLYLWVCHDHFETLKWFFYCYQVHSTWERTN